ncbi:MAG: hypothetical protein IJU98_12035 [Synergistaceae bacterium]|nr:hypothetical protein [Synergistaceae bacterium]
MNTDIRLSVDFWSHPKTVKLKRRLGLEGPVALQILWTWAAKNKPEGDLSGMDDEDIEIAAEWNGEEGKLVSVLTELRWLDKTEAGYSLHEWAEHNSWAADEQTRRNTARLSVMASKYPELYARYAAAGAKAITKEEYIRVTKEYKEQHTVSEPSSNDNVSSTESKGALTSSQEVPNSASTALNNSFNDCSTNDNAASSPSPFPFPLKTNTTPTGAANAASPLRGNQEAQNPSELLPVSEAPQAFRQAAEYLLLKTGRKGLTEGDIAALRTLNTAHTPARVLKEIDVAVDRYTRLKRPLSSLGFEYIAEALKQQVSRKQVNGCPRTASKGGAAETFSPPEGREFNQEQEDYLEAKHAGKQLTPEYWAYLEAKYGGGKHE